MAEHRGSDIIRHWPEESREAARLVIDKYGEPHEATESLLIWHQVGPCQRLVASRTFHRHNFPTPHIDAVECFIDYRVPPDKFTALARFDGSVIAERTAGEVSARCHDEEANLLALNLMHDIVRGAKSVEEARRYYVQEFLDYRRKRRTPYMERLHFEPSPAETGELDEPLLSEADLEEAVREGEEREAASSPP